MEGKEERSAVISLWVTPSVKKEFEFAKDNQSLQEKIIKSFIGNEIEFVKDEISKISEIDVRYKAMLLTIKDNFEKAYDAYYESLEPLVNKLSELDRKLRNSLEPTMETLKDLNHKADSLFKLVERADRAIKSINTDRVYDLMELIDKINSMSEEDKSVLSMLLKSKTDDGR